MAIPEKLDLTIDTKNKIKTKIESTGQSTNNKTFREYSTLIANIPSTGALTQEEINELTELAIEISGEKA